MPNLKLAGDSDSLLNGNTQANVQEQFAAMVDLIRQVAGTANVSAGNLAQADPLSAPFVLYVNPYTGSDKFVGGSYNNYELPPGATEEERLAASLKRIEKQRMVCGYTPERPFRTVNRAAIEAGIITCKSFYKNPIANGDLVSIIVMPGAQNALNGAGASSVSEWAVEKDPTANELQQFNSNATGGIIIPRGASLCSLDLRKTIFRPDFVPTAADEASDFSNRRAIFKVTGTGYYFGFTFMDKVNWNYSHHLLDCFQFASQAELNEFYTKIRQAFGGANNTGGLNNAIAIPNSYEYQIVGPRPASGSQTIDTDTTISASPYIFNCSIRSNYGLCGIFADGAKPTGFKSIVTAQFTGVSLQRDIGCWQKYVSNQNPRWGSYFANYADYITSDPNNVRMNPKRRSFHIRAVNDAIIQEVSVFAIGQGIHHWVDKGGEITITNSNSNFGGCAALAEGYKTTAFASDSNWNIGTIRVASNFAEKRNNVRKIYLGTIDESVANSATTIKLTASLSSSITNPGIPEILDRDGYTLSSGYYIWVENVRGNDYRALLASNAWTSTSPDEIKVAASFTNQDGIDPGDPILNEQNIETGQTWPNLAGARIYVRRLQDSRSLDERKYSLRCNNTTALSRTPVRDYILQTSPGSGSVISRIADTDILTVSVSASVAPELSGVVRSASVELRRNNPVINWTGGTLYRAGDAVRYQDKVYSCLIKNKDVSFDPVKWEQAYAHMEETYYPEDYWKNTQPSIIFDKDTDGNDNTINCGYNLETVWSTDSSIQAQYRSATDYRGVHSLLVSIGFSAANAHVILLPRAHNSRERNPNTALDGIAAPSGAANGWNNWAIEFRRPSNIRLFGHAWEWAGFLNYTKSLPEYQLDLSPLNKFTYYFTHKNGGRVYGSGFNEEGYVITPQGLLDLATGNEISFEAIGDSNVPIDEIAFPTSFDQLAVKSLSVSETLNLGGTIAGTPVWQGGYGGVLPALPNSTTEIPGIIQIASSSETKEFLRNDRAITPQGLIQAVGDAIKSVTNFRISLSSTSPVPSGNQSGSSIYIHPWNGSEVAIYSQQLLRWQLIKFTDVQTFSLASANTANKNYDIYLYNSGTILAPTLAVEYVAWTDDTNPPTRGKQDGILVKNGNPSRRLIGVVRTTTAGNSIIDLGGLILGAGSANFPRVYLANLYNLYDARAVYFFGNFWNAPSSTPAVVPSSVYSTAPRISWIQASETLVTAFMDIYNNPMEGGSSTKDGAILYVFPGIDSISAPPSDAFFGECMYENTSAGSQWVRTLSHGKHDIYYLYQQSGLSKVNEHPSHGMIVTFKV